MPTTANDVIGTAEAAAALNIDRSTLTRWVQAGKIKPFIKGSGKTGEQFFNRADITALISSPADPTSPEAVGSAGSSPVRRAS